VKDGGSRTVIKECLFYLVGSKKEQKLHYNCRGREHEGETRRGGRSPVSEALLLKERQYTRGRGVRAPRKRRKRIMGEVREKMNLALLV